MATRAQPIRYRAPNDCARLNKAICRPYAALQQHTLKILEHDVQSLDSALGRIPNSRVAQVNNMAVAIRLSLTGKVVLHHLLGLVRAVGTNRGVAVEHKDVLGVLLDNRLKRDLVAMRRRDLISRNVGEPNFVRNSRA